MADLSESAAQIELLDQNLKKTHQLSSRMAGILAHFDSRLIRLEKTLSPVHNSTQSLTRLGANIDATLAALATVRVNQEKTQSDETALMAQPNPSNLGPYLATFDRVMEHISDLKSSGLRGGQGALKENVKLAEVAFKKLCTILTQQIQDGTNISLDIDAFLQDPPRPLSILSTSGTLSSSNLATYLVSSPLALTQAKTYLDESFRGWGETRGSWMKKHLEGLGRRVLIAASAADEGGTQPSESDETGGKLGETLLALAKSEHALLCSLVPDSSAYISSTLQTILTPSLTYFSSGVLASLLTLLKKESAPWKAYTLWDELSKLSNRWDDFFESAGLKNQGELSGFMQAGLKGICLRSIPEAVESAKVSFVVKPGEFQSVSVSSVTTSIVSFLLNLPSYQSVIETFLNTIGDRKWLMGASMANVPVGDDDGLIAHFIYDVTAALVNSLDQRAKALRRGVGGIFLMNNMSFVRDNLVLHSSSNFSDLLGENGDELLNKAFKNAKATYLDPWNELTSPLLQASSSSSNSGNAGRQAVKDQFVKFWDLLDRQEQVHLTNHLGRAGDMKARMRDEVKTLVGKAYKTAVAKHDGSLGTKYIRISPDELDSKLAAMFK
ncbi:Exocyst complex protein Exo70 [Phaffia rhodozyma]|uniref:Exocyst complex protein EXO70 n=1 Tax=Phaffia rhodozyma TaxID=264483 RepID=A0A0F7SSU2_PHARH|nr:Exocyst complex protein Exo70 [Phaffia rhodozyma]